MPTMRDAYELLGLKPGVTQADIRHAFRRLAMQWHPDRNADPAAVEHFKVLRQAHDSLLAALSKASQENRQHAAAGEAEAPSQDTSAQNQAPRGEDCTMELELELEEAYRGGEKQICLKRPTPCTECGGSGEVKLAFTRLCEPCRGSGRVRDGQHLHRCATCEGRGYRSTDTCPGCGGSGQQTRDRWLAVNLPAGLVDGDSLRLAGEGLPHPDHPERPGDLHLRIHLRASPLYTRQGRDLLIRRPISALRLLLGGSVQVPHPAGPRHIVLEAGSATPRQIRVAGAGFPARGVQAAGDFIVELEPLMMSRLNARLRAQIEALETELQRELSHHLPELAAWEANWMKHEG